MARFRFTLEQLKTRKLVQWALAYLAGAWLVLQVLDILAQPFDWPDVAIRVATVLLAIGFFAVLVLAWYHGEKGAQRVSAPELVMITGILVVAGAAVAFVGRPPEGRPPEGTPAGRSAGPSAGPTAGPPVEAQPEVSPPATVPAAEEGSIAVLPFLDLSPAHDQEYFSDGLSEELLNVLAGIPELRVAARTSSFSFKGHDVPVDSIGRALRVANVLEGSVRKAGNRVRITAQLIDVATGYHRWSQTYDRELKDVFAIQDEISQAIVQALRLQLGGGRAGAPLARRETTDPEAHNLVLQALNAQRNSTREGFEQSVGLLRQAITRDAGYARAHALLASTYSFQAYRRMGPQQVLARQAREEVERALELDPDLPEAHYAAGILAALVEWDFPRADAHFARAIELKPGYATALTQHAWVLMDLGRTQEALARAELAAALDPLSPGMQSNLGSMYVYAGQLERGIEGYRSALALAPLHPIALGNLAGAYAAQGRLDSAVVIAERALAQEPDDQYVLSVLAYAYGRAGRRPDAERVLRSLQAQPEPSPYLLATAYAGLGDTDRVVLLLEQAVAEKDAGAPDLAVDPAFAPFRSDPRISELVERMGLR